MKMKLLQMFTNQDVKGDNMTKVFPELALKEWVKEHATTVSRIPAKYLSAEENLRRSRSPITTIIIGYKHLTIATRSRLRSSTIPSSIENFCSSRTSPIQILTVINVFQKGETEKILSHVYWPGNYQWRMISKLEIPGWKYPAHLCIYLRNLPYQLNTGIDWGNAQKIVDRQRISHRGSHWRYYSEWHSIKTHDNAWLATVELKHKDTYNLLNEDNRNLFKTTNIKIHLIHQRMSQSTYKEVVRFGHGVYGNDLLGRKLSTWDESQGLPEDLLKLLEPVFPQEKY